MADEQVETVNLFPIEKDERIGEIVEGFGEALKKESGYQALSEADKTKASKALLNLRRFRFQSIADFKEMATLMLKEVSSSLPTYIDIAMANVQSSLPDAKGVLVIYTGGTIGSAPKDITDSESPQIVKPWPDLKFAVPNLEKMGFPIDAISFVNPLDSCNVGPQHWRTMAQIIKDNYRKYTGFVILHGTDTMVYTGSALGLMLQDLSKPVVITGSQLAGIVKVRNDAHQNFLTALTLANPEKSGLPVVPEVVILFGSKILRGCRAKKMDAAGYDGFDSPNFPAVGTAGDLIDIDVKHIRPNPESDHIEVFDKMNTNVATIDVFPGIQNSDMVKRQLEDPNLKGVILRSYGAGNVPTVPRFLDPIEERTDDLVVVNVTQCPRGTVEMGLYETSQVLLDRGIIGGFDITPEAALCKLMILLGEYGDDIDTVKALMQKSIAGEQSFSVYTTAFKQSGELNDANPRFDFDPTELDSVSEGNIQTAVLRFYNVSFDAGNKDRAQFPVYVDLGSSEMNPSSDKFIRSIVKAQSEDAGLIGTAKRGESMAFDVSLKKDYFYTKESSGPMKRKPKISFTLGIEGDGASFKWDRMELIIFTYDK